MKCRRRNKAEELSEGLSTGDSTGATGDLFFHSGAANGLLSGIVGIGSAPIPGEPQYVALEIAKAFQKTAEFALARAATFAGDAFGDGIGREPSSTSAANVVLCVLQRFFITFHELIILDSPIQGFQSSSYVIYLKFAASPLDSICCLHISIICV